MNNRHFLILDAVKHLHCADYPNLRLAVALLCGATERRVLVSRSLLARVKDTYKAMQLEWGRTEHIIPVKAP